MTVSAIGADGRPCYFERAEWDAQLPEDCVFMFTRQNGHEFQPKYIGCCCKGHPADGDRVWAARKASARRLGADCLLLYVPRARFWGMEKHLKGLVDNLALAYRPPCNSDEAESFSGLDLHA